MSMQDQFLLDLQQSPEDWNVRSIFADWCEDNDQPELAACLRWTVQAMKRPNLGSRGVGTWFNAATVDPALGEPASNIPEPLFRHLDGGNEVASQRTYASLTEAELALYRAWQLAGTQGWTPDVG